MRNTLKQFLLTGVAIACALPVVARDTNAPALRAGQIGQFEEARKVFGSDIKNTQNQALGKIQDAVVDLESGRILYTVASINGVNDKIALPPTSFTVQGAPNARVHMVNMDRDKLNSAPKFTADKESQLSNPAFASEVYKFGGAPAWWEGANAGAQAAGSFNNVHKVSTLFDQAVKDVNNADLAKVDNVILDLHDARVPFVLLKREQGGQAGMDYAIPPNAFSLSADKQTLTTGIDQNTLNSAPRFAKGNLNALANRATALAIYKHYGKQPYFSELSPTSERTNTYVYPLK